MTDLELWMQDHREEASATLHALVDAVDDGDVVFVPVMSPAGTLHVAVVQSSSGLMLAVLCHPPRPAEARDLN